jgi:hypothetical protein
MSIYLPAHLLAPLSRIATPSRSTHPLTFSGSTTSKEDPPTDYYSCESDKSDKEPSTQRGRTQTKQSSLSRSTSYLGRQLEKLRLKEEIAATRNRLERQAINEAREAFEGLTLLWHAVADLEEAKHRLNTRPESMRRDMAKRADETAAHQANRTISEFNELKAQRQIKKIQSRMAQKPGITSSSSDSDTERDQEELDRLRRRNNFTEEKNRGNMLRQISKIDKRPPCGVS